MQDVPADGEIDWSKSINALLASPPPNKTVPRRVGHSSASLPYSVHSTPAHFTNTYAGNLSMIAALPSTSSGYSHIYGQPGQHHMGNWDPNMQHHPGTSAFHGYPAGYGVDHTAMVPFQDATEATVVNQIMEGQFNTPSDMIEQSSQRRSHKFKERAPAYTPYRGRGYSDQTRTIRHQSSSSERVEILTQDALIDILPEPGHINTDPAWVNEALRANVMPSINQALQDMPFHDPVYGRTVSKHGVIRFVNPPFYVSRVEVLAALGRNARVVKQPPGSSYHAIHILMERDTGKTQDVYVEVATTKEARTIYEQFNRREVDGRSLTLGNARAKVELSNQDALLRALFPQARKVSWRAGKAIVDDSVDYYYEGIRAIGFDGFLGNEETALLCKWLDSPNRSPFAQRCQNRPYECVITLLHKYPLDNADNIKMGDRKRLFDITVIALTQLATVLRSDHTPAPPGLTCPLLQELVIASFGHAIFSDQQKGAFMDILKDFGFGDMVYNPGQLVLLGGKHEFADRWPFLALQRQPDASDKLVRFYARLIREFNHNHPSSTLNYEERIAVKRLVSGHSYTEPFYGVRVDYGASDDLSRHLLSWRHCIVAETHYISTALRCMLSDGWAK